MMNKKILVAAASLALSVAVWAPQVLDWTADDETDASSDGDPMAWNPAEGAVDPADPLGPLDPMGAAGPSMPSIAKSAPPGVDGEGGGDPLAKAERITTQLESFSGGGRDVAAIVEALTGGRNAGAGGEGKAGAQEIARVASAAGDRAFLEAWSAEQELAGLLVSAEGALALLGHRVVRPGDRLARGRVVVTAIEKDGVALRCGEAEGWIELPPFMAQGRSSAPAGLVPEPAGEPSGSAEEELEAGR